MLGCQTDNHFGGTISQQDKNRYSFQSNINIDSVVFEFQNTVEFQK